MNFGTCELIKLGCLSLTPPFSQFCHHHRTAPRSLPLFCGAQKNGLWLTTRSDSDFASDTDSLRWRGSSGSFASFWPLIQRTAIAINFGILTFTLFVGCGCGFLAPISSIRTYIFVQVCWRSITRHFAYTIPSGIFSRWRVRESGASCEKGPKEEVVPLIATGWDHFLRAAFEIFPPPVPFDKLMKSPAGFSRPPNWRGCQS